MRGRRYDFFTGSSSATAGVAAKLREDFTGPPIWLRISQATPGESRLGIDIRPP
jgi:hypothetical protein